MCMSVIQGVGMCGIKKTRISLQELCIFIKGLFCLPNSLLVTAKFKGKSFPGSESLFLRVWL